MVPFTRVPFWVLIFDPHPSVARPSRKRAGLRGDADADGAPSHQGQLLALGVLFGSVG